ncbi:DNA adenine methylase [Paenibacillus sp. EPM92]|uniref:DNA adenine methylase n=1 Tax=Paenibacillus sp. EPM92 TaxID=1561195 RepID=UPI001915F530|nr:DNA adenine methylase [Paenibacillus sp. EPM92]
MVIANIALCGGMDILEGLLAPPFNPNNHPISWNALNRGKIFSIISYTGGKHSLVPFLVPLIEWAGREYNLDTFITATGGACRVLTNLDPNRSIYQRRVFSDLDYSVACLFHVLRDEIQTKQLMRLLHGRSYTEYVFKAAQKARVADDALVRKGSFDELSDPIIAASNMYITAKMSYAANLKSFNWKLAVERRKRYYEEILELPKFNHILKGLQAFRMDCNELIHEVENRQNGYDPKRTLIYCDCPYVVEECLTKKHYSYSWSEQEHLCFRGGIENCQSRVIICGYQSPTYDYLIEKYPNRWHKVFLMSKHVSSANSKNLDAKFKDEYIYCNFPFSPEMHALIVAERMKRQKK